VSKQEALTRMSSRVWTWNVVDKLRMWGITSQHNENTVGKNDERGSTRGEEGCLGPTRGVILYDANKLVCYVMLCYAML